MQENVYALLERFDLPAGEKRCERFGSGYINSTYRVSVEGSERRYILQRVNRGVFRRPEEVIDNIERVTAHLRAVIAREGGDPERETLTLVPALDGRNYTLDGEGELWRVYLFIEGATSYDAADTPALLELSGEAFGRFQRHMDGFPADTLYETIPGFHDTPARFRQLWDAASRDAAGRRAGCEAELAFLAARERDAHALADAHARGEAPLRVTHNDAKLNNVLLDAASGRGLCVIDLDTVMPGLAAFDFGDAIRFGANTCAEDEPDASKVELSLPMFEAFARGYLSEARGVLTEREIELLPTGAKVITLEQAARFLADHLNGDVYYGKKRENHNLDRARTQIALVRRMEEKWGEMNEIVRGLL